MRLRASSLFCCAAALMCGQSTPSFRSGVSLVHIDAEVVDGARVLDGFTRSDFRVLDNKSPQTITHFGQSEAPLDVILLFDISGSMSGNVEKIASAAKLAFTALKPGDRVAVMVFNTRTRTVEPFTSDLDAAARAIPEKVLSLKFGGGTFIVSAVDAAALYFRGEKPSGRRRAIVVITDNYGARTRREHPVIVDAWESDATVCEVIVRSAVSAALNTGVMVTNPLALALHAGAGHIAQATGGDVIKSQGDPGAAFREMMQRLRRRYEIYYPMPAGKPGQERKVEVTLTRAVHSQYPHATVLARRGYVIPPAR